MIQAVVRYCKGLKVFKLGSNYFPNSLDPIWRAIGSTLIELSGEVLESELISIKRHCCRVEKLYLWRLHEYLLIVGTELLKALKFLRILVLRLIASHDLLLEELTLTQVGMLLEACPSDLHVHLYLVVEDNDTLVKYLGAFGTRLRELTLRYKTGAESRVPVILSELAAIEKLDVYPEALSSDVSILTESILKQSMPDLRELHIRYVKNSNILVSLSHEITSLRKFSCTFNVVLAEEEERIPVEGKHFKNLFENNKRLHFLDLYYGVFNDSESATEEIADLISCLKVCKNLKYVFILYNKGDEGSEKCKDLSDACVPLRQKSMTLTVNSVLYLPS